MSETWTVLRVLDWTSGKFAQQGFDSPKLEAQVLLAHVLECERVYLYTDFARPLDADELGKYRSLVRARLGGAPAAYLIGEKEFWSMRLKVNEAVLIPRPDTESLVSVVLDLVPKDEPLTVADIATGSGAVALALAKELSKASLVACDLSEDALKVARDNVEAMKLSERVELRQGDLFSPLVGQRFDVIVSNPPYIPSEQMGKLAPEVRKEPAMALDGGGDGLDFYRRIFTGAPAHLSEGGLLALEHGHDQAGDIAALFAACEAVMESGLRKDLGGNDRVSWFRFR